MLFTEEIEFKEENYLILLEEKDNLLMKLIDEHKPVWKSYVGKGQAKFVLDNFKLSLKTLSVSDKMIKKDEQIVGIEPIVDEETGLITFEDVNAPIDYTGGIVIARELINEYDFKEDYPTYCYKNVYELIFENGVLITAIDHRKSMIRVRKNIDKGLRTVKSKKDIRCINKFLKESYYKNYNKPEFMKKWKKKLYSLK